ncbi:hypothetical protein CapIbe_021091, partial [Capra ibex]
MGVMAWG